MLNKFNLTRQEKSWILYDVANSAFVITVMTVLFPILYRLVTEGYVTSGSYEESKYSSIYMFVTAGIALFVALLAPILGTIADYKGNKKKFFCFFLALGIIGGFGIAIPTLSYIPLLVIFVIASVGFNSTNVFYDAFLIDVTEDEKMDKVSSLGFAMGYVGSLIPFFIGIIPYALVTFGVLDESLERLTIGIAFFVSVSWWLVYSIPLIRDVKQVHYLEKDDKPVRTSLRRLFKTFKEISKYKYIFIFLIAFLFYIDVVNGVIRLAMTIGTNLEISSSILLAIVVVIQLIAFPAAVVFGILSKRIGSKKMILFAIFIYFLIIFVAFNIKDDTKYLIWVIAVLVGSVQGGIQAISRSYFARILTYENVPKNQSNEFFGFFGVFSKFSGIFSPFIIGVLALKYNTNIAVLGFLIPLSLGLILFLLVPNIDKKKKLKYPAEDSIY